MPIRPDQYPVSTGQLLSIAAKQLGSKIPVIGDVIAAHDAVMQQVEATRMAAFLEELEQRITDIEKRALQGHLGQELLLLVADAVRKETRIYKTKHYTNLLVNTARQLTPESIERAVEVIEDLNRLNREDLALLGKFQRKDGGLTPMIIVGMLCGLVAMSTSSDEVPESVATTLPVIMRLQGFGLVALVPGGNGGVTFYNSRFDAILRQQVLLTNAGKTLIGTSI